MNGAAANGRTTPRRADPRPWTRPAACAVTIGLVALLAACGGRTSNPVSERSELDQLFTCAHLEAETSANALRISDLRDERATNRLRNLTRVPGALLGNPLSALALADPSIAVYREIEALERRNAWITAMSQERNCLDQAQPVIAAPPPPPVPEPTVTAVEDPIEDPLPTATTAAADPALSPTPAVQSSLDPTLIEQEIDAYAEIIESAEILKEAEITGAASAAPREATAEEMEALAAVSEARRRAEDAAALDAAIDDALTEVDLAPAAQ